MGQRVINTPASIYLYCNNIINYDGKRGGYYPTGRLFNDSCDCIAELEREVCYQIQASIERDAQYEQWKRDHRVL